MGERLLVYEQMNDETKGDVHVASRLEREYRLVFSPDDLPSRRCVTQVPRGRDGIGEAARPSM